MPSSRRPTTRWSTASRRSTSGRSCSTRTRRGPRCRSPTSPGSPTSRARRCCSSATRPTAIRSPIRAARKAASGALKAPRETTTRVMRTAEGFAGLAAGGPRVSARPAQRRDRPRPARRLGRRPSCRRSRTRARSRERRSTTSSSRSRPGRCAASSPLAATRCPTTWSRWCRSASAGRTRSSSSGNRIATLLVRLPLGDRRPGRAPRQRCARRPRG